MKITRTKFVLLFLLAAFAFQFISNSVLGPGVGLFPKNGAYFPGLDSGINWKIWTAKIVYPFKYILIGPFASILNDPDPAPPILVIVFGLYWTALAFALYYLIGKLKSWKKKSIIG